MVNENQEPEYHNSNILSILAGLLVGGLAGAVTMLLLAPRSGRNTRMQIREKGIKLRDRTTGMMEDVMAQARLDRHEIAMGGRQKAEELKQHGQDLLVEQLDRVSAAVTAGKKTVQSS